MNLDLKSPTKWWIVWNGPLVTVEIHTTLDSVTKRNRYTLQPYVEQIADDLKMTVVSIQSPKSPMNRRFEISSKDAVMIPENYKIPVKCATEKAAVTTTPVALLILSASVTTRDQKHAAIVSRNRYDQINAKNKEIILSSIDAEFVLILRPSAQLVVTNISKKPPGCYDCIEGAQIQISCKTERSSWITIQCEEQTFSIECKEFKHRWFSGRMLSCHAGGPFVFRSMHQTLWRISSEHSHRKSFRLPLQKWFNGFSIFINKP
ncbi:hypothetical protein COOONC_27455 [Cooperia oncophora]